MTEGRRTGAGRPFLAVLMGLDGTGKSTQASRLRETGIGGCGGPVTIHHSSTKVPGVRGLKERYHASLIRLLKRRRAHVDWSGGEEGPTGGGSALGGALGLYLLLGSAVKSLWYRVRYRGRVLLMDRYVLDDVVKVRWRFGHDSRLATRVIRTVPKPDVVVVLHGDPAVTYGRKKSLNCTYLEYLGKEGILELTLRQAGESGWPIRRVGIEGRSIEEVHRDVRTLVEEAYEAWRGRGRVEPGPVGP